MMACLTRDWVTRPRSAGRCNVRLIGPNGVRDMDMGCSEQMFWNGARRFDMGRGALIQKAFPFLNNVEREFLLTGLNEEEWTYIFGTDDDDDDEPVAPDDAPAF